MKKIIRRGVFESNSSSSHSISIVMEPQEVKIPKKIHFRVHQFHDYPWDDDYMDEMSGRANYLYACAIQHEEEDLFKAVLRAMLPKTILIFDELDIEDDWCYLINHQAYDTSGRLYRTLMENKELMFNYLFDDQTDVVITSDSSDAEAKRGKDRVYFDEFGEVKYGEE